MNKLPHILTLIIVIAFARLVGYIFRRIGQPPVMGEVLGGIILGPSVAGHFFPALTGPIFHDDALIFLKYVAELGILLYLFTIGLEIDLSRIQKSASAAVIVSLLSIVLPFGLGLLLADLIYADYAPAGLRYWEFALFIGLSLSVTAFPVLARILSDSLLNKTPLGELALTCAAIDDIIAWCLLAAVTGVASSSITNAATTIGLTILYIITMMIFVRPMMIKILPQLEKNLSRLPEFLLAFAILGSLISSMITEAIGIHALFGAFLFGAIIPHDSLIATDVSDRLQDFVRILFLPAFFALTGMKTRLGLLSQQGDWIVCMIIIGLAIFGKFGGAYVGGILTGNGRRESAILGILMNTRGLVELIVLNIGLSIGILSPTLFTMLVVMAITTTFMTGPLLNLVSIKKNKA